MGERRLIERCFLVPLSSSSLVNLKTDCLSFWAMAMVRSFYVGGCARPRPGVLLFLLGVCWNRSLLLAISCVSFRRAWLSLACKLPTLLLCLMIDILVVSFNLILRDLPACKRLSIR